MNDEDIDANLDAMLRGADEAFFAKIGSEMELELKSILGAAAKTEVKIPVKLYVNRDLLEKSSRSDLAKEFIKQIRNDLKVVRVRCLGVLIDPDNGFKAFWAFRVEMGQ